MELRLFFTLNDAYIILYITVTSLRQTTKRDIGNAYKSSTF